jgi:16S rRNA (cytidine1402-2'-O)-methyltransferase
MMQVQRSFQDQHGYGTLYLVATPIGNLEDMTYRAIRILREADIIAAEDTRHTRKLLSHFEITPKQLFSYHEHNKHASGPELIRLLEEGNSVALVSDAGLPAISDPGADLVRLAIDGGIPVVPVPGANAALSALIISGMPTERFLFAGFLPRDKKKLQGELTKLKSAGCPVIFYEAPHRLRKTLSSIHEVWGDCPAVVVREITKKHEEALRGTVQECIQWFEAEEPLGEICLIVEAPGESPTDRNMWWEALPIPEHVSAYEAQGLTRKETMKQAAADRGLTRRDVYQACLDGQKNS